jgi:hypothetical protein
MLLIVPLFTLALISVFQTDLCFSNENKIFTCSQSIVYLGQVSGEWTCTGLTHGPYLLPLTSYNVSDLFSVPPNMYLLYPV